jgi:hypothetical protein
VPRQNSIRGILDAGSTACRNWCEPQLAIAEPTSHLAAMLLALRLILWSVRSVAFSRQTLVLENLALRQQLAIADRSGRRPHLITVDRVFWVALRQMWTDWAASLVIVKPATVVAWHRRARLLREFVDYYHNDRTHLSLGKDPPCERAVCAQLSANAKVTSLARIGGLHHRYEWRAAA